MRARSLLAASGIAAALILAGALPAWAGDTIQLNLAGKDTSNTSTLKLGGSGSDADTIDVRGGYRGGYASHFYGGRGYYYGYRGGYRVGYYGYGWYRPYYVGGYAPIYRSYYYGAPVIYANPPVYYPSPYYAPISSTVVSVPGLTLSIGGSRSAVGNLNIAPNALPPQAPPMSPDGTYPYDGGPRQPIPMPRSTDAGPAPMGSPPPNVPLDGRTVSLPGQKAKLTYPAYGEQNAAQGQTNVVRLSR